MTPLLFHTVSEKNVCHRLVSADEKEDIRLRNLQLTVGWSKATNLQCHISCLVLRTFNKKSELMFMRRTTASV